MSFLNAHYDPEILAVLTEAFNGAWNEVQDAAIAQDNTKKTRDVSALRIMHAADEGVRDPKILRELAIRAIDGRASI